MGSAEEDFVAFVAGAWPRLVRTAFLLTGDHAQAEDLAQTALVRAHRRWRSIRRQDRPEVYVRRVMLNLHRSWWRRHRGREHLVAQVAEPAADGAPGDDSARQDRELALARALADLPPRMRATLVLRFYEDLTERQAANVLGCSVGTVKSQTSRGLTRLRRALDPAEGTADPARVRTAREA